jgi:hypothetical protein
MSGKVSKPWFAAKLYGYGSGLPITWQGWVTLLVYLGLVIGASVILPFYIVKTPYFLFLHLGFVLLATIVFMMICARKTEGGWRWRWGNKK